MRWPTTIRPMPMMRRYAGVEIVLNVTVVPLVIGRGHQNIDVLPDRLGCGNAKEALGSRAERFHNAAIINDDDGVRRRVQDRTQPGFALLKGGVARDHDRLF